MTLTGRRHRLASPSSLCSRSLLRFLLLGAYFALQSSTSYGLSLEVDYGSRKCIYEDFPPNTQVTGEFHVSGGHGEMDLDLFVTDPRGVVFYNKQNLQSQQYSFRTGHYPQHTTQTFKFCVVHQIHHQASRASRVKRQVSFTIETKRQKGATRSSQVATGKQLETASERFSDIEVELDILLGDLDEMREHEQVISEIGTRTTKTILFYSLLSIVVTLLTGFLNHYYLRFFFKQKKLM